MQGCGGLKGTLHDSLVCKGKNIELGNLLGEVAVPRAERGIDTMLYREEYECMYVVDVIHQDLG